MTPQQELSYRDAIARYEELLANPLFSWGERKRFRMQAIECRLRIGRDDCSPRGIDSVSRQYEWECRALLRAAEGTSVL